MSHELIAILLFSTMMLSLFAEQRVSGAIGFTAVVAVLLPRGDRRGYDLGFSAAMKPSSIPDSERATVEAAACVFRDEIAADSPTVATVVGAIKQDNADMERAVRPYRCT